MIRPLFKKYLMLFLAISFTSASLNSISWQTSISLENSDIIVTEDPDIAINEDNSGYAVFITTNSDSTYQVQGTPLNTCSSGKMTAISLPCLYAETPRIAFNKQENGMVVWSGYYESNYLIKASYYNGSTWGSEKILSGSGVNSLPQISMNSNGDCVAIWKSINNFTTSVQVAVYKNGKWNAAQTLSSGKGESEPQIAFSDSGNALAIWTAFDGVCNRIYSASYTKNSWGSAKAISVANAITARPQIAINSLGSGIASWEQLNNNCLNTIQAAIYTPSSGWKASQNLSNPIDDGFMSSVAINDKDNGFVTWLFASGLTYQLRASRFYSSTWSIPETISQVGMNCFYPRIKINNQNEGIAIWKTDTDIQIASFLNQWQPSQCISTGSTNNRSARIALNSDKACAIWITSNCIAQVIMSETQD